MYHIDWKIHLPILAAWLLCRIESLLYLLYLIGALLYLLYLLMSDLCCEGSYDNRDTRVLSWATISSISYVESELWHLRY